MSYDDAAKAMKAALEQGANFWNGVSRNHPRHISKGDLTADGT